MSTKIASVWQVIEGIHDAPNMLTVDSNLVSFDSSRDVTKRKALEVSLDKFAKVKSEGFNKIMEAMIDYYENSKNNISLQTSLSLFVGNPNLFYEVFWPQARVWAGRQYYILHFRSPIDFELELKYELRCHTSSGPRDNMLYMCSTNQRIPILTTSVERVNETIVPYEFLVESLCSFLLLQNDTHFILNFLNLSGEEIEKLVRLVVTRSKPVFIEFDPAKYKKEDMISVSIIGKGSILFSSATKTTSRISHFWGLLKRNVFELPISENEINFTIFPKNPAGPLWTYIFAPPHYELQIGKDIGHGEAVLENNAPNNPRLISYRVGRSDKNTKLLPLHFTAYVRVPSSHKKWLVGIDKLLATFFMLWLLGNLYYLKFFGQLALFVWLKPIDVICSSTDFLSITFTLVSFVFIARTWFFHEDSVYRICSSRFLYLLLGISFLALAHLAIVNLLPSFAASSSLKHNLLT